MKFVLCQNCNKKLLKIGRYDYLSIKCHRCKTVNFLSVENAKPETLEVQNLQGVSYGNQDKSLQQSTPAI